MDFNENDEEIKAKGRMIAITTLSVIGAIIIFVIIGIFFVKSFFTELVKSENYVLEINNNNNNKDKDKIIELLKNENQKYCDSIYKIEYRQLFPNDQDVKIYCKDEDNINFGIYDTSELITYIHNNGTLERR